MLYLVSEREKDNKILNASYKFNLLFVLMFIILIKCKSKFKNYPLAVKYNKF